MELELYAPVPDGYELVGFRAPKSNEDFVTVNAEIVHMGDLQGGSSDPNQPRLIVRKIKPRIKRSFRVDVLDEESRHLNRGETGIDHDSDTFTNAEDFKTFSKYTPCIVTELPVENE
jgi:hypothetical protein